MFSYVALELPLCAAATCATRRAARMAQGELPVACLPAFLLSLPQGKDQWAEPLRPRTPLMASAAQVQLRPQRAGVETQGAGSPAEGPVPSLSHRAALCPPVAGMSLCSTSQSDATRGTAAEAFVHSASVRETPSASRFAKCDVRSALTPSPVDAAQRLEVHFHPRRDVRRA